MADVVRRLTYCLLGLAQLAVVRTDVLLGSPQTLKSNAVTWVEPIKDDVRGERVRIRREVLSKEDRQSIVDLHNKLRSQEGADNMEYMKWNGYLASMADDWARGCVWEHGQPPTDNATMPFNPVGQNLYTTTAAELNLSVAMQGWYDEEKPYYHYDTLQCDSGKQCGHYTQVVWATSREVGCASYKCSNLSSSGLLDAHYLVCNYGPAGNFQGKKPYTKGASCSKCDSGIGWCTDRLCNGDCKAEGPTCGCGAICKNGATRSNATCTCSCADGWHGVDCSDVCKDTHMYCNPRPGETGWPPSWCNRQDDTGKQVRQDCPVMCKLCTYVPGMTTPSSAGTLSGCRITTLQAILIGFLGWITAVGRQPKAVDQH